MHHRQQPYWQYAMQNGNTHDRQQINWQIRHSNYFMQNCKGNQGQLMFSWNIWKLQDLSINCQNPYLPIYPSIEVAAIYEVFIKLCSAVIFKFDMSMYLRWSVNLGEFDKVSRSHKVGQRVERIAIEQQVPPLDIVKIKLLEYEHHNGRSKWMMKMNNENENYDNIFKEPRHQHEYCTKRNQKLTQENNMKQLDKWIY